MNKQIKPPKGIKIIAGLMFLFGLVMMILSLGFLIGVVPFAFGGSQGYKIATCASVIAEIVFIAPLFIIAGIGLWKIREWGLFTALIAFGARVSMDVIWTPMDIMFAKIGDITHVVIWGIITICGVFFAIISIVYLWKNRRVFVSPPDIL